MVSTENKTIAKYVLSAFGGKPTVTEFIHDNLPLTIDILRCPDRPNEGITSYATLGLSDYPMAYEKGEYPARVEIVAACATEEQGFANMVATAAFCIMRSQRLIYPGAVIPNAVSEYIPDATNKHFYFTTPFIWENSLKTLELETKTVAWLLAMPISDTEWDYLLEHGDGALEDVFERAQIDIFDVHRPPCL